MKPSPYFETVVDIRLQEPHRTRVLQWLNQVHCGQVHAPEIPTPEHQEAHIVVSTTHTCRLKLRVEKDGFLKPLTLTHNGVVYELVPKSLL
jgi:hypothetical protein